MNKKEAIRLIRALQTLLQRVNPNEQRPVVARIGRLMIDYNIQENEL